MPPSRSILPFFLGKNCRARSRPAQADGGRGGRPRHERQGGAAVLRPGEEESLADTVTCSQRVRVVLRLEESLLYLTHCLFFIFLLPPTTRECAAAAFAERGGDFEGSYIFPNS